MSAWAHLLLPERRSEQDVCGGVHLAPVEIEACGILRIERGR
jgi:hypothetical protein